MYWLQEVNKRNYIESFEKHWHRGIWSSGVRAADGAVVAVASSLQQSELDKSHGSLLMPWRLDAGQILLGLNTFQENKEKRILVKEIRVYVSEKMKISGTHAATTLWSVKKSEEGGSCF